MWRRRPTADPCRMATPSCAARVVLPVPTASLAVNCGLLCLPTHSVLTISYRQPQVEVPLGQSRTSWAIPVPVQC